MKARPDSPAILGLIGLAGLVIVGWIILTALGKTVPGEAWGLVLTTVGIVGGWVGKTLTSEPVEVLAPESLPISYVGTGERADPGDTRNVTHLLLPTECGDRGESPASHERHRRTAADLRIPRR